LIEEMLSATNEVRQPYAGPIVPAYTNRSDLNLVCDAARDGLIQGRMDWHRPVLYVNAVSYAGLESASRLAQRRGAVMEASEWQARADGLRAAWNRLLEQSGSADERAAICGLHPTWIVDKRGLYASLLERRRAETHDAGDTLKEGRLWTYFDVAAAHQWLLLGRGGRVWNDLDWLMAHQASPGVYTWWEGKGEENSFHRWEQAMGWVKPPHVTPHYWTAAEMALLQMDMLVAVDEGGMVPKIIIGAGVPPEWLGERVRVRGVVTRLGRVDWEWRKGRLTVRHDGPDVEIVAGPAFPTEAELRLR
jgi:hypothetical protein